MIFSGTATLDQCWTIISLPGKTSIFSCFKSRYIIRFLCRKLRPSTTSAHKKVTAFRGIGSGSASMFDKRSPDDTYSMPLLVVCVFSWRLVYQTYVDVFLVFECTVNCTFVRVSESQNSTFFEHIVHAIFRRQNDGLFHDFEGHFSILKVVFYSVMSIPKSPVHLWPARFYQNSHNPNTRPA